MAMDGRARRELTESMIRLADGDRTAFHPIFETLWPLLSRFSERMLSNTADAEDAAQQALLKIFARASEFDPTREALPWALAIAANECRTARKRVLRSREVHAVEDRAIAGDFEQDLIERELAVALDSVIEELRPEDRATLLDVLNETRPSSLGAATFRKRVQRAIERLRAAWRAKHGTL
jgi:RNA polymerase sigma-70 factor (ECF subfamily)